MQVFFYIRAAWPGSEALAAIYAVGAFRNSGNDLCGAGVGANSAMEADKKRVEFVSLVRTRKSTNHARRICPVDRGDQNVG
jgi:hypothetical protein